MAEVFQLLRLQTSVVSFNVILGLRGWRASRTNHSADDISVLTRSFLDKIHIPLLPQKAEVPYEVEIGRPQFHAGQVDDLGKVPVSVTPIEGDCGNPFPRA